jgi:hypothetical protein
MLMLYPYLVKVWLREEVLPDDCEYVAQLTDGEILSIHAVRVKGITLIARGWTFERNTVRHLGEEKASLRYVRSSTIEKRKDSSGFKGAPPRG